MRFLASTRLVFCAAALVALPIAAHAADAATATDVNLAWGAPAAQFLTAFGQMLTTLLIGAGLWLVKHYAGQPVVDMLKAAQVDKDIETIALAAIARTAGAVKGQTLEVKTISPVISEGLYLAETMASHLLEAEGGADGLAHRLSAWLSANDYIPAEASADAQHFAA
eukprot:gene19613-20062_t